MVKINEKVKVPSKIKITRNTRADGKSFTAGKTYKVGTDISTASAIELLKIGKAEDADKKSAKSSDN